MSEARALLVDFGEAVTVSSAADGRSASLYALLDNPPESFGMVRQAGYEATYSHEDAPWLAEGDALMHGATSYRLAADPLPIGDGLLRQCRVVPA